MTNKSKQRDCIIRVLKNTKSHPTAEWVYAKVREEIPNISLGTVYRNLGQLVDKGEIIKIQGVFEKDRYDGNNNRHSHLICNQCGSVVDFDIPCQLDKQILDISQGDAHDYSLTYYGLCPDCKIKKIN